jgi:hypothetical protein
MYRRFVSTVLIISLALPLPAHAGMLATESLLERERVVTLLERADVQAQLEALGVSPAEVKARVAALTDVEVAHLAARIDELPAGGVSILGAVLIVFLVLLITDILGYTKVFPFTKPMK